MKIADDTCHRALAYVAAVQGHGYTPTVEDVKAYATRASRRARPVGRQAYAQLLASVRRTRETPLVWLYRVNWLDIHGPSENIEDGDTVTITRLGRAALASLDEAVAAAEAAPATSVTLDKGDPIALAKVIGRISEAGPAALVDRYFREEAFLPVVQRTGVTRVLMGPTEARVAAIEQALSDYSTDRPFEVRVDEEDEYHDRYVIPDDDRGAILALGTSMSGVGARHSMMVEIKDAAVTSAMRSTFERVWDGARVLNPTPGPSDQAAPKKAPETEATDSNGVGETEDILAGEEESPIES